MRRELKSLSLVYMTNLIERIKQIYRQYPQATLLSVVIIIIFLGVLFTDTINKSFISSPFTVTSPQGTGIFQKEELRVLSVVPKSGPKQSFETFMVITIAFSEPLDEKTIQINTAPNHSIGFKIKDGTKNTLQIFPKDAWVYDKAILLTINAVSQNGNKLKEPVVYSQYLVTPPDAAPTYVY